MSAVRSLVLLVLLFLGAAQVARAAEPFSFSEMVSLEDMHDYLRRNVPLGAKRESVTMLLGQRGGGLLSYYPGQPGVERFLYDVNLCRLYVWRWNISVNYDDDGDLTQIYVNGEPVHAEGDPLRDVEGLMGGDSAATKKLYAEIKSRPEADLGESTLSFMVLDIDMGSNRADEEFIVGAGPSRADPANLGRLHVYSNVERWRSIFSDGDPQVVDYYGKCPDPARKPQGPIKLGSADAS